jgi:hypothetical protein
MGESEGGPKSTASQRAFKQARPEIQKLLKEILQAERQVQHMRRRDGIHEDILTIIKTHIR